MRNRLTYANVAATLALVFSMSGGALAATHYLISSTKQISPKVLKKLRGSTGATGATGATGKEGPQGKEGTAGKEGKEGTAGKEGKEGKEGAAGATKVTVRVAKVEIAAKSSGSAVAVCPAGSVATGGGVNPVGVTSEPALIKSYPSTGTLGQAAEGDTPIAWGGFAYNPTGAPATLYVHVICASP